MAAKEGLDKGSAAAVEEQATKELSEKAHQEKKKEKESVEVARSPELPQEEKLAAKDVADVLAPPIQEEEKVAEKEEAPGQEEAAGPKKEEEVAEKDVEEEGVKKVEDPAKAEEKAAEKEGDAGKLAGLAPEGMLVVDGAKAETEEKRSLGDVYFVASLAALVQTDANMLERNVKENGDRSYTVTFYEKDPKADAGYKPTEITVTPDVIGKEADETEGKSKEEGKTNRLMAIVKQAYIEMKGGEDKVGEGKGGAAMEALTGAPAQEMGADKSDAESMWSTMIEACTWNQPIFATTSGDETKALFSDSELKPWHAYVVLKVKEVNGKRMVTLRNPFGQTDGTEGNVIEVDLEKFARLYRSVTVGSQLPEKEPEAKKKNEKKDETKAV